MPDWSSYVHVPFRLTSTSDIRDLFCPLIDGIPEVKWGLLRVNTPNCKKRTVTEASMIIELFCGVVYVVTLPF